MITEKTLSAHHHRFFPLFKPEPDQENTMMLDLTSANPKMKNLDYSNTHSLGNLIFDEMEKRNLRYACGGYMEDREVYRRSPLFAGKAEEARSIHLGIDIWTDADTPVYLPVDGVVHSFQDNKRFGDYGPTIIMEHRLEGQPFFTLYGHLSLESIRGLEEGMHVKAGEILCRLGKAPVNGDWPPHLHFQVITDMQGMKGDYPGVAFVSEKEKYRRICPNPGVFFPKLHKNLKFEA